MACPPKFQERFFSRRPPKTFFAPLNLPNWRRKELVIIKRVPPQLRLLQHRKENFIPLLVFSSSSSSTMRAWSHQLPVKPPPPSSLVKRLSDPFLEAGGGKEWCGFRPGFSAGIFWKSLEKGSCCSYCFLHICFFICFFFLNLFRNFYVKLKFVLLSALSFAPPPLRILVVRWTDSPPALGPPLSSPSSSLHSEWSFSPPYIIM